jgi:excisionase family DNA binding protein
VQPNTQETTRPAANAAECTPANPHGRQLPFVATKAELAEIFRCSIKHIEHLTARGLLKSIRLGRSVRYRRDSVIRALEQLEGRQ